MSADAVWLVTGSDRRDLLDNMWSAIIFCHPVDGAMSWSMWSGATVRRCWTYRGRWTSVSRVIDKSAYES